MPRQAAAHSAFPGPDGRIKSPSDLVGEAKAVFIDTVLTLRADHFSEVHGPLLAAYARAVVLERRASAELAREPVVDDRPSAWLPILLAATRTMTVLASKLRLNPSGKSSAAPEPTSYYDRMRLMEARGEGSEPDAN